MLSVFVRISPLFIVLGLSASASAATPSQVADAISRNKEVTTVVNAMKEARSLSCAPLKADAVQITVSPLYTAFEATLSCDDGQGVTRIAISGDVLEAADGGPLSVYPRSYVTRYSE